MAVGRCQYHGHHDSFTILAMITREATHCYSKMNGCEREENFKLNTRGWGLSVRFGSPCLARLSSIVYFQKVLQKTNKHTKQKQKHRTSVENETNSVTQLYTLFSICGVLESCQMLSINVLCPRNVCAYCPKDKI